MVWALRCPLVFFTGHNQPITVQNRHKVKQVSLIYQRLGWVVGFYILEWILCNIPLSLFQTTLSFSPCFLTAYKWLNISLFFDLASQLPVCWFFPNLNLCLVMCLFGTASLLQVTVTVKFHLRATTCFKEQLNCFSHHLSVIVSFFYICCTITLFLCALLTYSGTHAISVC